MQKIIHYCWFGNKPLSKIARKCIKSWKKFFPDYEIKEWNEDNFNINICPFVKKAYEEKKWAFVSDYARLYALYNYGGIYFDTDMEVISKCDFLCKNELFIGYEANNMIAAGVIGVKEKNSKYIKELLEFYDAQEYFDPNMVFNYAIPKIITKIWSKYNSKNSEESITVLDSAIHIYPEEYFYPINYDYSKKMYTKNTCMVHYYNATWAPKEEKFAIGIYRVFGRNVGKFLLHIYYKVCNFKNRIINFFSNKIYSLKFFLSIHFHINKRVLKFSNDIKQQAGNYIVISHPDWIGVKNSAMQNFNYNVFLREQHTEKEAKLIAKAIGDSNKNLVVFNGFAFGWEKVAKEIKALNSNVKTKIIWHGSNSLLCEEYDYNSFINILNLLNLGVLDEIAFVKKSMYEFYKNKGYKTSFLMNTIIIEDKEKYKKQDEAGSNIKIGLYSSGDRWVKNTYNQISAASLVKNAILDIVPFNFKMQELARIFDIQITGSEKPISHEELFKRIAQNDINLYVTFTECAPLLPLESLELGVPCITGDNHHYFDGTELEKYLVVTKEDNIIEIYNKIQYVLKNKDNILNLYKKWKINYDIKAKQSIEKFIN